MKWLFIAGKSLSDEEMHDGLYVGFCRNEYY